MLLVTGADGYLGWPTALALAQAAMPEEVWMVDHHGRRAWVAEVGAASLVPIADMAARLNAAREVGIPNLHFQAADLRRYDLCAALVREMRPRAVVHLAAQPSAPYSHIDAAHAAMTQENNLALGRNLLWALREAGLERKAAYVTTTTMGIYGAPTLPVPEGEIMAVAGGLSQRLPFPPLATSWYHMSKAMDALNLQLAATLWRQRAIELRTAIVVGASTPLTRLHPELATRLDADFCFGVVAHRFAAQALAGRPLTIYGKGAQRKPFIALPDAVSSIVAAVARPLSDDRDLIIYNQATSVASVADVARAVAAAAARVGVACRVEHRPNPRRENEENALEVERDRFLADLMPAGGIGVEAALDAVVADLTPHAERLRAARASLGMAPGAGATPAGDTPGEAGR